MELHSTHCWPTYTTTYLLLPVAATTTYIRQKCYTYTVVHTQSNVLNTECYSYAYISMRRPKSQMSGTGLIMNVIEWKIHLLDFSTRCKDVEMTSKNLTLLNNIRHLLNKVRFLTSFRCLSDKQKNQTIWKYTIHVLSLWKILFKRDSFETWSI